MTRICSPRSTSPRRRELSSLGETNHQHPDSGPHAMGRGCVGMRSWSLNAYAKGGCLGSCLNSERSFSRARQHRLRRRRRAARAAARARWQTYNSGTSVPRCLERFHDLPRRPTTPARSGRAGSMVSRSPTSGNKPRHAGLYYDIEPDPRRDSVPNLLHGVFRQGRKLKVLLDAGGRN
jgi:hypothetical protein